MSMKNILALLLAMMLMISACAFAETADETETTAEETVTEETAAEDGEEVLEHDYEVITDPIIASFGDVEIHVSDAMPRFMSYYNTLSNYSSYGIDVSSYVSYIKQTVLAEMVQLAIEEHMVTELGYDQFTEEELTALEEDATDTYNEMYAYYYEYFELNSTDYETDIGQQVTDYLAYYGYSKEDVLNRAKVSAATDKMVADLTKDVTVTEEDLQEYYDALVAEDQSAYQAKFGDYEQARTYGSDELITWNPDGYRRVWQVLIAFDDDTKTQYAALQEQLDKLLSSDETEESAEEETSDEPALTVDEIKAQMAELTAPLYETAAEVTEKFNNGADISELITEYSADTEMPEEGYYVCANSELWDSAFIDAAFSVTEIGQLSAGYAGQHGVYMVYYLDDVPGGTVEMTEEVREMLTEEVYNNMQLDAYYGYLDTWKEDLGVETNLDFFVTGYES